MKIIIILFIITMFVLLSAMNYIHESTHQYIFSQYMIDSRMTFNLFGDSYVEADMDDYYKLSDGSKFLVRNMQNTVDIVYYHSTVIMMLIVGGIFLLGMIIDTNGSASHEMIKKLIEVSEYNALKSVEKEVLKDATNETNQ